VKYVQLQLRDNSEVRSTVFGLAVIVEDGQLSVYGGDEAWTDRKMTPLCFGMWIFFDSWSVLECHELCFSCYRSCLTPAAFARTHSTRPSPSITPFYDTPGIKKNSLGKTRYSLYSSCCSTDFHGHPRSTIFISSERAYAISC